MITKEQIEELQKKTMEDVKPIREQLKNLSVQFEDKLAEIEKPLLDLIENYYDQELIDKNNESIRKGNTITDGKSQYYVHNRGMQFFFGNIIFNPRIMCKKVDEKGYIKPLAKEKHIHPSELKEYWIL